MPRGGRERGGEACGCSLLFSSAYSRQPAPTPEKVAGALDELGHVAEEAHPEALHDPGSGPSFLTLVWCSVAAEVEVWGRRVGRPVEEPGG